MHFYSDMVKARKHRKNAYEVAPRSEKGPRRDFARGCRSAAVLLFLVKKSSLYAFLPSWLVGSYLRQLPSDLKTVGVT